MTKHSKEMIEAWKAHQLRTVRQDQSRMQILEQLSCESVLITQDWAMKFLPRKYRELQSDWFGKRGISWHISVAVRRHDEHLESQGFVHIIHNCTQGSSAVVSIMAHVLETLKNEHPEILKAFFRQDNAGCYHGTATIASVPAIEKETGVQIAQVAFSDPQGGKGAADRMATTIKGHISRYVNERTREKWRRRSSRMGASLELELSRLNASVNQKLSERNRRLLVLANLTTLTFRLEK